MHIFASVSEHLDVQGDIFISCLPLISMSQWNYLGLFCSQNGRLHTAINLESLPFLLPHLHTRFMKSDWLGSLKTPHHLLEVVTPRAPQGYPNFSTGEEKIRPPYHLLAHFFLSCWSKQFSPGANMDLPAEEGNCIFPPISLFRSPGMGCSSSCTLPCIQSGGWLCPPHPPLPGFIHQLQKEDWLQPLPTTHASSCRWLPSGRAHVHNLASTHLSGSAGYN